MTEEQIDTLIEVYYNQDEIDNPVILKPKRKCKKIEVVYRSPVIQSTVKKGKPWARKIIGMNMYQALYFLEGAIQKIPKFLQEAIISSAGTIGKRSLDPNYTYIKGIITSKKNRTKKMTFKAKGSGGKRFRDYIDFKILYARRNIKDFYKNLILGKGHEELSFQIRNKLQNTNSDLEEIKSLNWILTSKGRQQNRLIFKRKVLYRFLEFQKAGTKVSMKLLMELQAEKEATEFMAKWDHIFNEAKDLQTDYFERKQLYESRINNTQG